MMPNIPPILPLAVAALMLAGCGAIREEKKTSALEAAVTAYGSAIRWGYYETAFGYVHPDKRKALPANIGDIQVTNYDVVQPPVMQDDDSATQIAQIDYVLRDVQRVRSVSDRQLWRYDQKTKTWWLHSGVPTFK